MLLLVVSQHLSQLPLLILLQSGLLNIHLNLLLYLIVLFRYLFGHFALNRATCRLFLNNLLIHHLRLLLDLFDQCLVLRAQHGVLLSDLAPSLGIELLGILAYLLLDHRQVVLEVGNDLTPLLLLRLDYALVVLLQVLVLVLVLTRQDLVFVQDEVGTTEMVFINSLTFETNNLLLDSDGHASLMHVFKFFKRNLLIVLIKLLNLSLFIAAILVSNRFDACYHLRDRGIDVLGLHLVLTVPLLPRNGFHRTLVHLQVVHLLLDD